MARNTTLRAWVALTLGSLFFIGTLSIAAVLVSAGVSMGSYAHEELRGRAMLLCFAIGVVLMIAGVALAFWLWPRLPAFKPPGPELKRELHPALFKEIDRVAARCGVTPPKYVYLAPGVEAFVSDVGGFAGFFPTRVMAIGLPLLHCLSRAEFRSVLAHEFGHFLGGDTRIGNVLFRMQSAIGSVAGNLTARWEDAEDDGESVGLALLFGIARLPFVWFHGFYLRFSLALYRAQELAADAQAAQLEGVEVLVRALTRVRGAAIGFDSYFRNEVVPLLEQGVLPPVGAGLLQFLDAPGVPEHLTRVIAKMDEEPEHALDTHPPLVTRIKHARGLRLGPHRGNATMEGLAFELITHVSELELLLAEKWVRGAKLKRLTWEQSGPARERAWRERAQELRKVFGEVTPRSLPRDPEALRPLLGSLMGARAQHVAPENVVLIAAAAFTPIVTVQLLDAGFIIGNSPGASVRITRGDEHYEPTRLLREWLFDGKDEAWLAMWDSTGLADVQFARSGLDDEPAQVVA